MSPKYLLSAVLAIALILAAYFAYTKTTYEYTTFLQEATSTPETASSTPLQAAAPEPIFIAVGDIMLGRNVENLMNEQGDSYPFAHISDFLKNSDSVIANLEGPVLEHHTHTPSQSTHFEFDTRMPQVLRDYNVHIVNLANNHTYDAGVSGFIQTKKYLDSVAIVHAGTPYSIGVDTIATTTIQGKQFIFVGFNITNPNFDFETANAFIQAINKQGAFLIAMVHGGEEYQLHSNTRQETFYRALIDDGADLVVAHHPHVVEEIEEYHNKLIFYSLGNFIFDQYFDTNVQQELAVKMTFAATSTRYELIPLQSIQSQPALMNETDTQKFLKNLAERSPTVSSEVMTGIIDLNTQ